MKKSELIPSNNGIYIVFDEKFNEIIMSIRMLMPLNQRNSTFANVMANIFSDRLQSAPTKAKMLKKTDDLYGAKMNARTYSVGKDLVIEIMLKGIHQDFVEEALHQAYYDLLLESLKRPLINENTFLEAKKNVKQSLLRLNETPSYFALFEGFRLAGKDQTFGVNVIGDFATLETMTLEEINAFHQSCLHEFKKEFYAVGRFEDTSFVKGFEFDYIQEDSIHKTHIKNEVVMDVYKGNQSEIVQIYETDITPKHPYYYAYLTLLGILGQSPNSLLFQNIREKNSLCYSIYASQLILDGLFYISTSVSEENEERVIDLIKEQFEIIEKGEFDLDSTKQYLINRMQGTTENARQLLEFYARNNRLQLNDSIEDLIANFEKVEKEDVIQSLDYIKDHFTYIYRGEENETN